MKTLMPLVQLGMLITLASLALTSSGCATREKVVVRQPPVERVYVAPGPPVVQEKVIVR
jgi:hypothetical protein